MVKRHAFYFLAVTTLASAAVTEAMGQNPDPHVAFDGVARTGADTRQVSFRFLCSSNQGPNITGVLSVELEIPRFEELGAVFDFIPFEGPDAHAGKLTELRASGFRTKATGRFSASGSIHATGSGESFELDVTASRRDARALRKLAAVLRPLLEGPGQLTWRQGNAKAGGTPLIAGLDLTQAQTDKVRSTLGPCLGGQ